MSSLPESWGMLQKTARVITLGLFRSTFPNLSFTRCIIRLVTANLSGCSTLGQESREQPFLYFAVIWVASLNAKIVVAVFVPEQGDHTILGFPFDLADGTHIIPSLPA